MYRNFFKRGFDIFGSLLALIILSPLFLFLAIIVKINMGGQVIFRQVRPGKNGKLFVMYKFRSMKNTRGADGNLLPDELRKTKFGNLLRKTSLDELPQLWNILKGDMSFVGPRPRDIWDAMYFDDSVRSLDVRPGLTGRSQAYGRNDNTWSQIFEHDKIYVEKITIWKDIAILFKTVGVIFKPSQAEKESFKWYPEELLANGKITQDEFEKSYIESRNIERAVFESRKGYLVSYKENDKIEFNAQKYYDKTYVFKKKVANLKEKEKKEAK